MSARRPPPDPRPDPKSGRNPGQDPAPRPGFQWTLPVARLKRGETRAFDIRPDEAARGAIADLLGVSAVRALRYKGTLAPEGADDWRAEGRLTAEVVQPCVVTLAPVTQLIDEPLARLFVPEDDLAGSAEVDLDVDGDDPDGYGDAIELGALLTEGLALALDPYPRAENAELAQREFAPPGAEPLGDEAVKPFAGLEALRAKLSGGGQ